MSKISPVIGDILWFLDEGFPYEDIFLRCLTIEKMQKYAPLPNALLFEQAFGI